MSTVKKQAKLIAYCGTRAIYTDMETSAKSFIANSSVDAVYFIIEDDEFPAELPEIIHCVNMAEQPFFKADSPNMDSGYTYMAMMRIALCHVLPDVDVVLSLDADTIAKSCIDEIWKTQLDDCYFAACPEWHRTADGLLYCNFGVVLYNLAQLRDGKTDECIEVLNRRKYTWVEQDVGNYLCQGRICELPATYNSNWWTDQNAPDHIIKHYAGIVHSQWANLPEVDHWRNMDWGEVMKRHAENTNRGSDVRKHYA